MSCLLPPRAQARRFPFRDRFDPVALIAERLQVIHRVGPTCRLGQDVVHLACRGDAAGDEASLAKTRVAGEDLLPQLRPLPTVAALGCIAALRVPAVSVGVGQMAVAVAALARQAHAANMAAERVPFGGHRILIGKKSQWIEMSARVPRSCGTFL